MALFAVVVFFVLVAAIAAEVVRRSDLPRRLLVDILQQQTGLRVQSGRVLVGWDGSTVVRGVKISLPLEDGPFATLPEIRASHTPPLLVPFQGFALHQLVLDGPEIDAREDNRGGWNLVRALEAIASASAPAPGRSAGPARLPSLVIENALIRVHPNGAQPLALPLTVRGDPISRLRWDFEATLGASHVAGRIATTDFEHRLSFEVPDARRIASLWITDLPAPFRLAGEWDGVPTDDGLRGELRLHGVRVGEWHADGALGVSAGDGGVLVRPRVLVLRADGRRLDHVTLAAGEARVTDEGVRWSAVHLSHRAADAEVSGVFDPRSRRAELDAVWESREGFLDAVAHRGTLRAEVVAPRVGPARAEVSLTTSGTAPEGAWDARIDVHAQGADWRRANATVAVRTLEVTQNGERYTAPQAEVRLSSDWPRITLDSVSVPGADAVDAHASFDATTNAWSVSASADDVPVPGGDVPPLDVRLSARGDSSLVELQQLTVSGEPGRVEATGSYRFASDTPLRAELNASVPVPPEVANGEEDQLRLGMHLDGTLEPLAITLAGNLSTPSVKAPAGSVGPLDIPLHGRVNAAGASVSTDVFPLVGGEWRLDAQYKQREEKVSGSVQARGVDIGQVSALLTENLSVAGVMDASISLEAPGFDFANVKGTGSWTVEALASDAWGGLPLRGAGEIGVRGSELRAHAIDLAGPANEGSAAARVSGEVMFNAARPDTVHAEIRTDRWPVAIPDRGITALLDSSARLELDTASRSATGDATIDALIRYRDEPLGVVSAQARADGRTIRVPQIRVDALGGVIEGDANLGLDDWRTSRFGLEISGLSFSEAARHVPGLEFLRGAVSGRISGAPSESERALGPFRVQAELVSDHVTAWGVEVGDARAEVFTGGSRTFLDRADVRLAGGDVRVWSRLSWHGDEPFLHTNVLADNLALDQIVHAMAPETAPTPGRVALRAVVGGYLAEQHRAFGEAEVTVTESDLQPVRAFGMLYSLMNADGRVDAPTGVGNARLRLEDQSLVLSSLRYFNRGTDIIGSGRVADLRLGKASGVHAGLAATARPLKDSKLPFSAQLDRMIFAAIHDAASVRITGTLERPEVSVVPFSDVSDFVRGVFGTRGTQ